MHKPKILLTIPNFDTAGSGKVVYDLAKGLSERDFTVEIACGNNRGSFFKEVEKLGIPIHIFNTKTSYKPYGTLLFRILKIAKFYRKYEYDIIHSWQWSSDWTEALAARIVFKKWIYTKKAMGFSSKHWKIKSMLASHIITINNDMQSYFQKKKSKSLIPLGIDVTYYDPKLFKKKASTKEFNIVSIVNMVPVKGIEMLIHAVKIHEKKKLKLALVGDDTNEYGTYLKDLVKELGLSDHIEFKGKQLDVRPFLSQSDLFVIPTLDEGRREGMPMALVEAMSMAKPVIGSKISGIKYVLNDFQDLLFEAGNTQLLAEKLEYFYNLPEEQREDLGGKLRRYCVENFSIDRFIENHELLYKKIV